MASYTELTVKAAALPSAKRLGYDNLKELQLRVVAGFVSGRDVSCLQAMEKASAMAACLGRLTVSTSQSHLLYV